MRAIRTFWGLGETKTMNNEKYKGVLKPQKF